jgi:hypothetical protein
MVDSEVARFSSCFGDNVKFRFAQDAGFAVDRNNRLVSDSHMPYGETGSWKEQ